LLLVAAIGIHHPDVVAAATIGRERNAPAVGREAGLMLIGEPIGDPRRCAACDRHRVDIAQQIKRDQPPVRRRVDVHPAAFIDCDPYLAGAHAAWRIHVPLRSLCADLARG